MTITSQSANNWLVDYIDTWLKYSLNSMAPGSRDALLEMRTRLSGAMAPQNPDVSPTMLRCLAADIQHTSPSLRELGYVKVLTACAIALETLRPQETTLRGVESFVYHSNRLPKVDLVITFESMNYAVAAREYLVPLCHRKPEEAHTAPDSGADTEPSP